MHAVAHGADYLGACAATGIATGPEVLELLARRVVAPGDAWRDQEEARVALAATQALGNCDPEGFSTWLTVLNEALTEFEESGAPDDGGARPPGWLHNVSSTCSILYVTLAGGRSLSFSVRSAGVSYVGSMGDVARKARGRRWVGAVGFGCLLLTAACSGGPSQSAGGPSPSGDSSTEATKGVVTTLDPTAFAAPTAHTNKWLPLRPGNQWVRTGATDVGHRRVPHQVTTTVTNVMRKVDGVPAVAVMDQDVDAGQVVQESLDYMATDAQGNVWFLGSYTQQYDGGRVVSVQDAWLSGVRGGEAGILVPGHPRTGSPPYSIARPPGEDSDVAQVVATDHRTCVPFGCFSHVLVVREGKASAPDNEFKYYSPGLGQVLNTPRSASQHHDLEKLVNFTQLSSSGLRQVSGEALRLDRDAQAKKPEVFGGSAAVEFQP